jgi:hypothetical protein
VRKSCRFAYFGTRTTLPPIAARNQGNGLTGETLVVAANRHLRLSYRDPHPMVRSGRVTYVLDYRPPLTAEDLRIHAWIDERLAALHREWHGLWAKVRRFLFGNRPLGLQPNRVAAETRRPSPSRTIRISLLHSRGD